MYKFIIAGGRDFNDMALLEKTMTQVIFPEDYPITVVSGMARGADMLGVKWAKAEGVPVEEFPAQWDKYGKSAGYKRNAEMLKAADAVLAFWDGKSRGTKNMIDIAGKAGVPVHVVMY